MFDKDKPSDAKKLLALIERQYRGMAYVRDNRRASIRTTLGNHFVDPKTDNPELKGMMVANVNGMAMDILVRSVISHNPKVFVTTEARELTAHTEAFEAAINDRIELLRMVDPLERSVYETVAGGLGLTLVGREPRGGLAQESQTSFTSKTIIRNIDPDFVSLDTDAQVWEDLEHISFMMRIRHDDFLESEAFPPRIKRLLKPVTISQLVGSYDMPDALVQEYSASQADMSGEQSRYAWLWFSYLPKQKQVFYLPAGASSDPELTEEGVLWSYDWTGHEVGPIHKLIVDLVPGNLLGRSPLKDSLMDLGNGINDLVVRTLSDARSLKNVGIVDPGHEDTAKLIKDAKHGEYIAGRADATTNMTVGGIDQRNLIAYTLFKQLWDELGGNLRLLGGLQSTGVTATENTILDRQASQKIEHMRNKVLRYVTDVCDAVAQYEWEDPAAGRTLEKELSLGVRRRLDFGYGFRTGSYKRWRLNVHPYSLQQRSPAQMVAMLDQFVNTIVLPNLNLFHESGVTFDIRGYAKIRERLLDMPMFGHLLVGIDQTDATQLNGSGGEPRQNPVTNRIETRRSEQNPNAQEEQILRMLSGAGNDTLRGAA